MTESLKNKSGSLADTAHQARTYPYGAAKDWAKKEPARTLELKDAKGRPFKGYNVAKTDYPELEGKIIYVFSGSETQPGLVVGCNTSVGITIVDVRDKDSYMVCITGEVAPGGSNISDWDQGIWQYLINSIGEGKVSTPSCRKFMPIGRNGNGCPDGHDCAYRQ